MRIIREAVEETTKTAEDEEEVEAEEEAEAGEIEMRISKEGMKKKITKKQEQDNTFLLSLQVPSTGVKEEEH